MLSAWGVLFTVVGIMVLTDDVGNLSRLLQPMTFVLGLICSAWTAMGWKLGCLSMVGNMGQVHHYFRKEEPIGFYIVLGLYIFICLGLLAYPASQLLAA